MNRLFRLAVAIAWAVTTAVPGSAATRAFAVDPASSRAIIDVGKAGAFSFLAGHTHEVLASSMSGTVDVDADDLTQSTVRLEIKASALKVTGKGEPAKDVPEVQRVMLSDKVLDVERYPTILFQSTGVKIASRAGPNADLLVAGRLTLHNVTQSISVPVHVELAARTITASGRFAIKQTDYGIKPVSVAGVVNVKDSVDINVTIVARN